MGGDGGGGATRTFYNNISIHASVWEATSLNIVTMGHSANISIHASVWEATPAFSAVLKL